MSSDIANILHDMQQKDFKKVNQHIQNLNPADFKIDQMQFLFDVLSEVNKYCLQDTQSSNLSPLVDLVSAKQIISSIHSFLSRVERPFSNEPDTSSRIFFDHVLKNPNNMREFLKNPVVLKLLRLSFMKEEFNWHLNKFFNNHFFAKLICENTNPDYFQNEYGKSILVQAIEEHHTFIQSQAFLKSNRDILNINNVLESSSINSSVSIDCLDDLFTFEMTMHDSNPLMPDFFSDMSEEEKQFHFFSNDIDEVFNVLIAYGADVNGGKENFVRYTPLMDEKIFNYYDPFYGQSTSIHDEAKLLFRTMNPLMSPLSKAILLGYTKRAIRLLEEPNLIINGNFHYNDFIIKREREPSYLMFASYLGHEEIIKKLLERTDILINEQDATGETALFYATRANKPHIVKLLLEAGACTEVENSDGLKMADLVNLYQYADINVILNCQKFFTNALINGGVSKLLHEKCNTYYEYDSNAFSDEDKLQITNALSNIHSCHEPKKLYAKLFTVGEFNAIIFDEHLRFAPNVFNGLNPSFGLTFLIAWTQKNKYLLVTAKVENLKMLAYLDKSFLIRKVMNLPTELINNVVSFMPINHILNLFDNYIDFMTALSPETNVKESGEQYSHSLNHHEGAMIY